MIRRARTTGAHWIGVLFNSEGMVFFSQLKNQYLTYWLATLGFFAPSIGKRLLDIPSLLISLFIVSVIAFVIFSLNFYVMPLIKQIGKRLMGG